MTIWSERTTIRFSAFVVEYSHCRFHLRSCPAHCTRSIIHAMDCRASGGGERVVAVAEAANREEILCAEIGSYAHRKRRSH